MIKASKIFHRGADRLKLDFPFDTSIANQIRQIKGSAWSQTNKAWLVPFTDEAVNELRKRFPDIVLPRLDDKKPVSNEKAPIIAESQETKLLQRGFNYDRNLIKIDVIGRKIILKMPKNDADIKFLNTLKYSHWDARMFC